MDRATVAAVVVAVLVIVAFAIQGWWLFLGLLAVASGVFGFLGWRAGLPLLRARDD